MNFGKLIAGAAFCATLVSGGAQAAVVFSDNFNGEGGGVSVLNYASFANWDVTGQVDLVKEPGYGITCNTGSCVDLDGTTGPGQIAMKNAYSFNAGDTVNFTFDISGNQRGGPGDNLTFGFTFGGLTQINNVDFWGTNFGSLNVSSYSNAFGPLSSSYPWTSYTISFVAANAGNVKFFLGTDSADNVGILIDNVSLSIGGAVPEPATWAMMIMGFGLAGSALRRRRALAA